MFLQAGFNPRAHRTHIRALVLHRRVRWRAARPAELVRFRSGDYAWWGAGGAAWPESMYLCSLIDGPAKLWPHTLERCALP